VDFVLICFVFVSFYLFVPCFVLVLFVLVWFWFSFYLFSFCFVLVFICFGFVWFYLFCFGFVLFVLFLFVLFCFYFYLFCFGFICFVLVLFVLVWFYLFCFILVLFVLFVLVFICFVLFPANCEISVDLCTCYGCKVVSFLPSGGFWTLFRDVREPQNTRSLCIYVLHRQLLFSQSSFQSHCNKYPTFCIPLRCTSYEIIYLFHRHNWLYNILLHNKWLHVSNNYKVFLTSLEHVKSELHF
jgi:hypothetical protein